ncbi:MAG: YARHG domain-containing protein [Acidobacteriota bacterium]
MIRRSIFLLLTIALAAASLSAQQVDPAARAERWKQFSRNNFDKLNFSTVKLTKTKIANLKEDENADDFALLRGVIFGKRGRIFKERSIQEYLEKQAWYKANRNFSNAVLTAGERANLDFIRLAEAQKHPSIEPGDMRIWKSKPIADDNLREYTGAELTILIAEIEAIHGKPFQEDWLQKYFDERYWYKKNTAYNPSVLNEIERKNIERLNAEKEKGRHTAVSIGDMDNFQNTLLTEEKLAGLSLLDLRILREEFYARHGKKFDAPGVRDYFNWRDWYKEAKDQKSIRLNKIEQQNVDLLTAFETKQRERLSTEPVTDEALGALFAEDLRLLRNEIYARHGRVFKDKDLQKYFDSQAWYKANPDFKDDQLSEVETANLTKLKQAEESATSKFSEAEG